MYVCYLYIQNGCVNIKASFTSKTQVHLKKPNKLLSIN